MYKQHAGGDATGVQTSLQFIVLVCYCFVYQWWIIIRAGGLVNTFMTPCSYYSHKNTYRTMSTDLF